MTKNPNTKTIYVRDSDLEKWEALGKNKSDFVHKCLNSRDYQKHLDKYNNYQPKSKE